MSAQDAEEFMFVPLSGGKYAVVDPADFAMLREYSWSATKNGSKWYAATYVGGRKNRRKIYMHRLIMGNPHAALVDHRDNDGLNNRRGNLRIATKSQNTINSGVSSRNTSGVKGVRWDAERGLWSANIRSEGKSIHLGRFRSKIEAAAAYEAAAERLHGEFQPVAGADDSRTICLFTPPKSY